MTRAAKMRRGESSFRITGESFTHRVQQFMLDDDPGRAYRLATGIGSDDPAEDATVERIARRLCEGEIALEGDESGMDVVERDHPEYRRRIAWLFAGRIRIQGTWYQPIAYVEDVGPMDLTNDHGVVVRKNGNRGFVGRAWHYAGKDEIVADDVIFHEGSMRLEREVIFQRCEERPAWQTPPRTTQLALEEFLAAGRWLEKRGHVRLYGTAGWPEDWLNRWPNRLPPIEPGPPGDGPPTYLRDEARRREAKREADEVRRMTDADRSVAIKVGLIHEPQPSSSPQSVDEARYAMIPDIRIAAQAAEEIDPVGAREAKRREQEREERLREERQREEEMSRQRRLADLRGAILAQAGDDLIEFTWPAEGEVPAGSVMIPRAPFLIWSFSRLPYYRHVLPAWKTICPTGMKMNLDDPNHTDWIVGGGLDPEDRDLYWGAKADAAMDLRSRLQDEFDARERALDEAVTVLVAGPRALATVVHGQPGMTPPPGHVVVLPDLRTRYLWSVQGAAAVISEVGGEVAHLVQISREGGVPVLRAEGALSRWPEGTLVEVDSEERTVRRVLKEPKVDEE